MEGLSLSSIATTSTSSHACGFRLRAPCFPNFRNYSRTTNISLSPRKPRNKLLVFAASGNESDVRKWVDMELEWGKMIGEDPEFTLAKIVGRKSYPGLTDLELQKLYEKEGKAAFPDLDKLPFDLSEIRTKPSVKRKSGNNEKEEVPSNVSEINGFKLVRPPVPKKGFEKEIDYKPRIIKKRIKPVVKKVEKPLISGPSIPLRKPTSFFDANIEKDKSFELSSSIELAERKRQDRLIDSLLERKPNPYVLGNGEEAKSLQNGPSITLRKPTSVFDENIGTEKSLELSEESDSSLENREEAFQEAQAVAENGIEKNNIISLLQKPEIVNLDLDDERKPENSLNAITKNKTVQSGTSTNVSLLQKPEIENNLDLNDDQKPENSLNGIATNKTVQSGTSTNVSLLQKPEIVSNLDLNDDQKPENSVNAITINETVQSGISTNESLLKKPEIENLDLNANPKQEDYEGRRESNSGTSFEMVNDKNMYLDHFYECLEEIGFLHSQPERLDSSEKQRSTKSGDDRILMNLRSSSNTFKHENISAKLPIKPNPLIKTLESALIDQTSLEAVQPDMEWTEVDLLVKELEQYEGIQSVSKGQYFLSPGLAPKFQVYIASMFEDHYKLLARSENKVQEVFVITSLSKEEMKKAISTCTNRVK